MGLTNSVSILGPNPFSDGLLPFNDIPLSSESPEARDRAKQWLFTCKTSHEQCGLDFNSEHFIPTRLLKLDSDKVHVVIKSELIDRPDYVALSYCWGTGQSLTTTKATLHENKAGILFDRIPKTLLDAINVTKSLGFRYLWVDALCILQNDSDDWLRESTQMEKVYGNAQVVLAAAVATSSSEGFLRNRLPYTDGVCTVSSWGQTTPPFTIKYRLACSDSISPAPLDTRAWAFQERTLARRYLMFGEKEMKWVCKEAYLREAFPDDMKRHDQSNLLLFNNVFKAAKGASVEEQQTSLTKQWRRWVVPEYTKRNLTKRSDKLVALSAVASRFQSVHRGTYLAGLWKEDLLRELLWKASDNADGPEPDFTPSWSWASVRGGVEYGLEFEDDVYLAEVIDSSVVSATSNPFGSVSEGIVKLRGKMFQGRLFQQDDGIATHNWRLECDLLPRGRLGTPYLDMDIAPCSTNPQNGETGTEVPAMRISAGASKDLGQNTINQANEPPRQPKKLQVWVVPLTLCSSNVGTNVCGLLLGQIRPDAFQRLGMTSEWYTDRRDFDGPWKNLDRREIILL